MARHPFGRDPLHRWEGNPILTLEDMPFPCNTVFNGTPAKVGDEYCLLIRVEGQQGHSFFALATSPDGLHFTVEDEPVLNIADEGPFQKYESHGIEDPRATFIDGTFHILYTAVGPYGYRIALAVTDDFRSFERVAMISEPGNKDGVLFPEKINGQYVRLDRPNVSSLGQGDIWISFSPDLVHWGRSRSLGRPDGLVGPLWLGRRWRNLHRR